MPAINSLKKLLQERNRLSLSPINGLCESHRRMFNYGICSTDSFRQFLATIRTQPAYNPSPNRSFVETISSECLSCSLNKILAAAPELPIKARSSALSVAHRCRTKCVSVARAATGWAKARRSTPRRCVSEMPRPRTHNSILPTSRRPRLRLRQNRRAISLDGGAEWAGVA